MGDVEEPWRSAVTVTDWTSEGIATVEATGSTVQAALEAGLRGVLELALSATPAALGAGHSAPVRGEGDDLPALFAEMVEDLLDQIAFFGNSLHEVVVDGVLRRDGGGYIAWGYAVGTSESAAPVEPPQLLAGTTAVEHEDRIIIRASLRRS